MSKPFVALDACQLARVSGGAIMGSRALLEQVGAPKPQPQPQPQPAQPGILQLLRGAFANSAA